MPYPDDDYGRTQHARLRAANHLLELQERLARRPWHQRLLSRLRGWWWLHVRRWL